MKISGTVVDRENLEPVPGALVRLADHESVLAETMTGKDGHYRLAVELSGKPHLLGRPAQVKATLQEYEPDMADFTIAPGDYQFDFKIHGKPETLVVLINQLDGSPIPEVEVLFTMGKAVLHTGVSDAEGLTDWTVPAHRLDQQALLKVNKDGWYGVERLVLLRRDQPRVQITLEPSVTENVPLSGRIFDDLGHPLAGAKVTLELARMEPVHLTTDAEGRWSLILSRDAYGGEGLLHAEHPDYQSERSIKLPIMPNAMHVVPMTPLRPRAKPGLPKGVMIGLALALLALILFFALRG